jgi:hypothetical protein
LAAVFSPTAQFVIIQMFGPRRPLKPIALLARANETNQWNLIFNGSFRMIFSLLLSANDGQVKPYHSKKMAARLQAVSKNPVLLRVTFDGGHGIGRSVSQKVEEEADVYAFLFAQLGIKY